MSKLVCIKNMKAVRNRGKTNEQVIRFDHCDEIKFCQIFRDLDRQHGETEYDVRIGTRDGQIMTAAFDKFDDARRLMEDLVHILQNKDHHFVELNLLDYETK